MWLPKERQYLLWVPLADLCRGLREKMLAPALMDICGNYDLWDFVIVCTTYPRMGRGSSYFWLCGTMIVAVFMERVGRACPIRGASGPVECSDPCLQERVDRARPIRGVSGPVEFFDPSL